MPGYSGKSLADKLGFKPGMRVLTISAPNEYPGWLGGVTDRPELTTRTPPTPTAVHLFATKKAELDKQLKTLRPKLAHDGMIWVSWPKKTSGVVTDITEDSIRQVCLPMGFVDIKVCAV